MYIDYFEGVKKMSKLLKIVCILVIIIILIISINIPVLVLEDTSNSNIIYISNVAADDEFKMKWMHSVELQPWEEIFKIDKDLNIVLDRTRFKSFGAGVPDYGGNKTELKDGYVTFSGIDKPIKDLQYGISNFAKHTFYFKNMELKLYRVVEDGNAIKVYTRTMRAVKYYILKLATSIAN